MITRFIFLFLGAFILLGMSQLAVAQAVDRAIDLDIQNEDDILQLESDGRISEETALTLLEMLENPIDLNRADVTDLIVIPGISRREAQAIVDERRAVGGFARWRDVSQIDLLTAEQLRVLRGFAEIRPRVDRFDGQIRLDTFDTRRDDKPYGARLRMRTDLNKQFFLGVVAEHEDDLQYQWAEASAQLISPAWRFDKLYLAWSPGGVWRQVIVGNFTAGFGAGLTFNDAHRFTPKGIYTDDTTSSFRQRGIAGTWQVNRWRGALFVSDANYSVTLPSDVTRLPRQRRINRVYNERLIGAEVSFDLSKNTRIGGVGYSAWIDKRVKVEFRNLPNRDRWSAVGIYAKTSIQRLDLRGEISHSVEAGWASYFEAEFSTRAASFLTSLRRYGVTFDNPHSHGFADSDDTTDGNVDGDIDEVGVFVQVRYRPDRRLRLRAYYDQWQHPSSLQTDNEAYTEIVFLPLKSLEFGVSGKWTDNEISVEGDERRSGLLWFRIQPLGFWSAKHNQLHLSTVYRRSRHRTLSRVVPDDYIYVKLEWLVTESVEWEMRWKINDTHFIDGDTFPKEFYAQLQLWGWGDISGRIRYTQSRFAAVSTAQLNPKHKIFARLEYEW